MKLKLIPRSGSKDLVAIGFDSNLLKIAHLGTLAMGRKVILNLVSQDIGELSEDDLPEIIKTSLNKMKIRNPQVMAIIPPSLSITKNIEIPSVKPQEIKEIIDLQASRYTPYTREEVILDYIEIGTYRAQYTKILLIMVNRGIIRKQFEIVEKANLEIKKVVFEPEGINHLLNKVLRLESKKSPVGIIHLKQSSVNFSISLKGKIIFNRNISFSSQELVDQKENYAERCCRDIKDLLEDYKNEGIGESPELFILTGAIKNLENLEDRFKKTLSLSVKSFPYQQNLPIFPLALETIAKNDQLSFLDVIAPLLIPEQLLRVDLFPEEIKANRVLKEKSKSIVQTGILIVTILALLSGVLMNKIYFKVLCLNKLKEQYQPLQQKSQVLMETFARVQLIKTYLSGRGTSLEVLDEIYNLIPLEIYLKDIKFNQREESFSFKGISTSRDLIYSLVEKIEKSKYFKDAKTSELKKREENGENLIDFELTTVLERKGKE